MPSTTTSEWARLKRNTDLIQSEHMVELQVRKLRGIGTIYVIGTARNLCEARSTQLSGVRRSVCPIRLLRICCCGLGRQEISIDCCTAGAQMPRRAATECGQCQVVN